MNKEFLPYKQSKELKELGFDEPCLAQYVIPDPKEGNEPILEIWNDENTYYKPLSIVKAPLYQQVLEWFKTKHNYVGYVIESEQFVIGRRCNFTSKIYLENCRLELVKKLIEILKEKL